MFCGTALGFLPIHIVIMGADFTEFQKMHMFALEITPADNVEGFITHSTTKCCQLKTQGQEGINCNVFIYFCGT
jgi:hypothetical protein